jgi:CHAT domain-containing protein/predicted negative regulator of RcsB-dependent stress response
MNTQILIPRTARRPWGRLFPVLLVLLVATFSPSLSQTIPQNEACTEVEDNSSPLNPGEVLTRTIKANQRHIFRVSLTQQQYVHVVVDQKGVDLVIRLLDPNKAQLVERDNPNGKFGPEAVSTVAQSTGSYYVDICADKRQPIGSYELKVEGPRPSSAADEKRVAAELMLMEGRKVGRGEPAIEQFKNAASIFHELGDSQEEGYALSKTGETYRFSENFSDSMKYLDQAFSVLGEARDVSGQAYVLNEMGAAYRDLDVPSKALDKYALAIPLRRSIGDRWGEAQLLNNVGRLYTKIGEQHKALDNYELALSMWRELNDRTNEMQTLNNIAKANNDLGNLSVALPQLREVLNYCGEPNASCAFEAAARNNLAMIYDTFGEPNEALAQYDLALKIFRERGDLRNVINTLNNYGMVYANNGDASTALDKFQEALNLGLPLPVFQDEAGTRSNIGYAHILLGNYTTAVTYLEKAQPLSQKFQDPRIEAYAFLRLGMAHIARNEVEQALGAYNQALEKLKEIEDRRGQAMTLEKIGELYSLSNQPVLANKNYRLALERWAGVNDAQGEALSLYGIAQVEFKQNHLNEARDRIVEAITKIESLRMRMTSYSLRTSYYASKQDYFELETDIRMRLYSATRSRAELEAALFASERARARNLLDLLTESRADIRRGVDPQLLALERTQRDRLSDKLGQLQKLLNKKFTEAQRTAAEKEVQTLKRELDQTQAEIRRRSPRYAALTQPQPLKPAQVQQLLDDDTLLLEYALGEKRSYLWVVSRNDVLPFVLPGRAQIENAAQSFRESLRAWEPRRQNEDTLKHVARLENAPQNYQRQALELSNLVLWPAASKLGKKRLVILADGALQYVPFGALLVRNETRPSKFDPLIVNNEIVYQPSASALALIREAPRSSATKTVAVLADPVFSRTDNRVVGTNQPKIETTTTYPSRELKQVLRDAGDFGSVDGNFRLDRLSFTRGEAEAIIAAAPPGSSMKALDFDANRARVLDQELKQYRMVHLATHGFLDDYHPELSGLVFSLVNEKGQPEDGFLKLNDIYNLDLPIDMIVLSACQSAIGKQVKGEGVLGLTRGFMHAGAARVVASLWNVDDEATAKLMKRFYSYLLEQKMPAAAALRQAQLDLMQTYKASRPYYWAGFVLQGEWK